jgi:hypothetical protein
LTEAPQPVQAHTYNRIQELAKPLNGDGNKAVRENGMLSEEEEVPLPRTREKILIKGGILFTGTVAEDEIVCTAWSAQVVTKNAAQVFTCFSDLLPELRIKIWKFACYEPRTVDLWQTKEHECFTRVHQAHFVYKSHAHPPAILLTSHEARIEGLKHYILDFSTRGMRETPASFNLIQSYRPIYVNPKCDIICPIPHPGMNTLEFFLEHLELDSVQIIPSQWVLWGL